jgi:Zn-dependent protease
MNQFRIARILGVDILVDASWILIFVLMVWNIATTLARMHGEWGVPAAVALGVLGAVLFFVCILLHELAHSFAAQRFGLRVRSITLFLFGGVSNIEQEPPSARAEFVTAVVGPLASLVLGTALGAIAVVALRAQFPGASDPSAVLAQMGPFLSLLVWLASSNIVIGIFNLVPAYPLDGGRVLRAVLWGATGNLPRATALASTLSRAIGLLFIAAGITMAFGARIPLLGSGGGSGLWLAFVGWFVLGASRRVPSSPPSFTPFATRGSRGLRH